MPGSKRSRGATTVLLDDYEPQFDLSSLMLHPRRNIGLRWARWARSLLEEVLL
jgi:hypothetical protein